MRVNASDGRAWRVGRRWLPWEVRRRRLLDRDREPQLDGSSGEGSGGGGGSGFEWLDVGDELGVTLAVAVLLVVLAVLAITTVLPLVILLIELIVALLVVGPLLFARVVLRRPWTIAARTHGPPSQRVDRQAVGWRASGRAKDELAKAVSSGAVAAPPGGDERPTSAGATGGGP